MKMNDRPPYGRTVKQTMREALIDSRAVALLCIILGKASLRILLGSVCFITSSGLFATIADQEIGRKLIFLSLSSFALGLLGFLVFRGF